MSRGLEPGDAGLAFDLPNANSDGPERCNLSDVLTDIGCVVVFTCNHCPTSQAYEDRLISIARDYPHEKMALVAISPNDPLAFRKDELGYSAVDDTFDGMKIRSARKGFPFPYLYDESQEVARNYRAACTPDFFLYDSSHNLVYRGQYDDSRPDNGTPTGADLSAAIDALLGGEAPLENQKNSIGCNIKWKAGSEPDYFNP